MFLWLAVSEKLLTRTELVKRRIVEDGRYSICRDEEESLVHALRDCKQARGIWNKPKPSIDRSIKFWNSNAQVWLKEGCLGVFSSGVRRVWEIWKARCSMVFQKLQDHPQSIANRILSYGLLLEAKSTSFEELRVDHVVRWRCPEVKMIKLNVDGAANMDGKQAGAGGVFRNHKGSWIHGFWFNVGATEGDWAELWGLREGLRIAVRERFCPLIIESDSMKLVQAINKGVGLYHPWKSILQDCNSMMQLLSVAQIHHIFREANACVDSLAKMGKVAEMGLHEATMVPEVLAGLLERDAAVSGSSRVTASSVLP